MIRPELFTHEKLFAAEQAAGLPLRLAFVGLWTQCDREGRFAWRPLRLKLAILPWDEIDFDTVLVALADAGFIKRYEAGGESFGWIPSWLKHQKPHHQEAKSAIPPPPGTPSDSPNGANGFGDSPSGFAPSHEATRMISPGTQDETKDGDGIPLGEDPNDNFSPEWMTREFLHRYRGPIKTPRIEDVSRFFAGLIETTKHRQSIMEAIKDKDRDSTQTLLDFGNWFKARQKQNGKANGKHVSEEEAERIRTETRAGMGMKS